MIKANAIKLTWIENDDDLKNQELYGRQPPKEDFSRPDFLALNQLNIHRNFIDKLTDANLVKKNVQAQLIAIEKDDFKTIEKLHKGGN